MAARYKAYPEYQDSEVEWLGEVPADWAIYDGKRIFKNRRKLALTTDEQLAASQKFGVVPQSLMMQLNDSKVMLALKGTSSFRHVEKDDYVISLRSFEGGIEHSDYTGCVSPAYTVLHPLKRVAASYYKHLFKSRPFISALQSTTDSLRDGKSITYEQFGAIPLVLPEPSEQKQIAKFLDHETGKIDALIEKQQALISLLQEKRQAVISHAVTKGLNPEARMKDSGVEWLGDVPEHWEVVKCGHYLSILSGYAFPSAGFTEKSATSTRLLRGANVGVSKIKWNEVVYWNRCSGDHLERFSMREGDIVLGMDRPVISEGVRVARVSKRDLPCLLLQRVICLRPCPKLNADFLFLTFTTEMFHAHFLPDTTGVSVPHISPEQVAEFRIALPSKPEQLEITKYIQRSEELYSKLMDRALDQINLLQERRTALISAAVTGKIDVRDWEPAPEAQGSVKGENYEN
jgi:type I restriction enzyme, S subunit